jgi:hypothetical protein
MHAPRGRIFSNEQPQGLSLHGRAQGLPLPSTDTEVRPDNVIIGHLGEELQLLNVSEKYSAGIVM